jgi:hypothetical protein
LKKHGELRPLFGNLAFEDLDLDNNDEDEVDFDTPAGKEDITITTELERELLKRLRQAESHIEALESQFIEYKTMVRQTFLDDATTKQIIEENGVSVRSSPALADHKDDGNYYFNSYAQNGEWLRTPLWIEIYHCIY